MTEQQTTETQVESLTRWEWIGTPDKKVNPTVEEVEMLLKSLPQVWGVDTIDFVEYIVPIGSSTNIAGRGQPEQWRWVVRLYMSVAGRVKMLERAQDVNEWRKVALAPEKKTPTGIPGVLRWETSIVYRTYCKIWVPETLTAGDGSSYYRGKTRLLGSRSGTSARSGDNSIEKAETAANGRAIAAWGFGVLPGSGIASAEEMQNPEAARYARLEAQAEQTTSRPDLIQEIQQIYFEAQSLSGAADEEIWASQKELLDRMGLLNVGWDDETHKPIWDKIKTGQLMVWRNDQRVKLDAYKAGKMFQ